VTLEQRGDLRRALDEWKIALTLDPADTAAREGKARVERTLDDAVTTRVRLGQEALRRGAHLEARRHLLATLALDPANKTAFTTLRDEVKEVRAVFHVVARGDTLGAIAERYYGDRSRAEVIWETNKLPANPRLVAGTRLTIPEIPGVPFMTLEPRQVPSPAEGAMPPPREPVRESPREEIGTPEIHPLLTDARDARERREFPTALAAIDRLLEESPRNAEWLDFKKSTLYDYGKDSMALKRYDDAYRALAQLARLDPRYKDTGALQRQARVRAIEVHYNEGIRLYREEKLEGAIARWRAVLEYDSGHTEARRNIEQAERILKLLDERQRR
jgi:tetratricopeptide (TPR) repeat protein